MLNTGNLLRSVELRAWNVICLQLRTGMQFTVLNGLGGTELHWRLSADVEQLVSPLCCALPNTGGLVLLCV